MISGGARSSTPLHVVTLTPFYPTASDDANGCFVAEPLPIVAQFGIHNSVLAVQPWHRGPVSADRHSTAATWIRYVSIPSGLGLASAGAFLFAHIVGRLRTLHREHRIDVLHAHGPLPCGHAAMLAADELKI